MTSEHDDDGLGWVPVPTAKEIDDWERRKAEAMRDPLGTAEKQRSAAAALTKAEERIAELEVALAHLLSAHDHIESMRGFSERLPSIAEWCWELARQALATKPQEAEASREIAVDCLHCSFTAEGVLYKTDPNCPTHGAKP